MCTNFDHHHKQTIKKINIKYTSSIVVISHKKLQKERDQLKALNFKLIEKVEILQSTIDGTAFFINIICLLNKNLT